MKTIGRLATLLMAAAFLSVACTTGASPSATTTAGPAGSPGAAGSPIPGGLLDVIVKAGKVRVSTDPQYPPQSELKPDGTYEGFDIDVATEIARRLGVDIEFATPS